MNICFFSRKSIIEWVLIKMGSFLSHQDNRIGNICRSCVHLLELFWIRDTEITKIIVMLLPRDIKRHYLIVTFIKQRSRQYLFLRIDIRCLQTETLNFEMPFQFLVELDHDTRCYHSCVKFFV